MWYVYFLSSAEDSQVYSGSTNDLKRRIREHRDGLCVSTRNRRPLVLEAYIAVRSESVARDLEAYCKSGSGKVTLRKRILTSGIRKT
jgi:putative endonuclease